MNKWIIKILVSVIVIVIISIIANWDYLGKRPEKIKYQSRIYKIINTYKEYDLYQFFKNQDKQMTHPPCIDLEVILYEDELRYVDDSCYGTFLIGFDGEVYKALDILESEIITIQELQKLNYPVNVLRKIPSYTAVYEECEANTPCEPSVQYVLDGYEWLELE